MACALDLYELFPWIIQYKDALASGSASAEGILHKITYALEQVTCETELEIEHLTTLLDADSADPDFLLYLSATLGTMTGAQSVLSGGLDYQRWLVRNLVSFYKIKGTHPSWAKRFQHHFRDGTLAYWYQAWELWKEIPYEIGNYSRLLTYTQQLRAARFDLSYLANGSRVFLTPTAAESLVPYIETARPLHVLLRHNAVHVNIEDTLATATESFDLDTHQTVPEVPSPLVDVLGVALECGLACETGTCEGYCESGCQGAGCESACQAACTTAIESAPELALLSCRSSCESGSCEGSCQAGSCQAGCQSVSEIDKYPVHIEGTRGYNTTAGGGSSVVVGHDNGVTIYGRIWFPHQGFDFASILVNYSLTNPWWITPPGTSVLDYERLKYEAAGSDASLWHFEYESAAGVFERSTLIPSLTWCNWTEVHCIKPAETTAVHAIPGNGVITRWTGDLQFRPHPGSVRFEAILDEERQSITGGGQQLHAVVIVSTPLHDFRVSDPVSIYDDTNAETSRISSIVGARLNLQFPLQHTYDTTGSGRVYRKTIRQTAHTEALDTPSGTGENDEWLGTLGGDIAPAPIDSWVDHRESALPGVDFRFDVTWKSPPPAGSLITAYYLRESQCSYYLEQTFQYSLAPVMGGEYDMTRDTMAATQGAQNSDTWQVEVGWSGAPDVTHGANVDVITDIQYSNVTHILSYRTRTLRFDALGRFVEVTGESSLVTWATAQPCPP